MASGVLTGTSMLKSKFIEARIKQLTDGYKVTDAIFAVDNTDAQTIKYEDASTQVPIADDQVEERSELGKYPRIGMDTDEKMAMIKDYGLEIFLSWDAVTKNQISTINRAFTKLGNSLVRFVDQMGFKVLLDNYNTSSTRINTQAAGASWSSAGGNPIGDLLLSRAKVNANVNQYEAKVAVVNTEDLTTAMLNKDFRTAMDTDLAPEDKIVRSGLIKGKISGLTIIESRNINKGFAWIGEPQMVGTRYQNTNGVETDQYRTDGSKKAPYVVSAFREFVDVTNEPKAGTLLYGL